MEHSDLVAEMAQVEHLTTQERLHLARRRRMQQLKLWSQREKEWLRNRPKKEKSTKRNIYFSDSVMLLEAAARNDIDEVRRLLQRGVTPDATNEDGLTALHQCCIDNNEAMMKLLLEHGADVNAEDSERWTPLHAAATCGNLHLVRVLIQRGADLLAVNGDGNMPYDICEDEATLDAIEGEMAARGVTQRLIDETRAATELRMLRDVHAMLRAEADLDEQRDAQGATLLHIASANGYVKVAELLLENRAATDVMDQDMWRPVHAAACWGHLEILDLLVQYGADLNVRNKHDETPADICEDSEMRGRIVRLATEQEESRRRALAAAVRHTGSGSSERLRGARRSSSTASSSRVRSVRRTSLREKQLAAKQDARGEARLRENFDASDTTQQGFANGVENDQNVMNQMKNGDIPQKRSSTSSTVSNQSSNDSDEYGSHKQIIQNGHKPSNNAEPIENNHHTYNQTKNANPLYGVNAASQYAPATLQTQPYTKSDNTSSDTIQSSMKDLSKNYLDNNRVINGNPMPNGIRKSPEGQDNDSFVPEDEADGRKESVLGGNQLALSETGSATHYTTDNNGKINVHVTVMINAATPGAVADALPLQMNPLALSPSGTVPRFTGNTGEVVGDARSNRCCIIM